MAVPRPKSNDLIVRLNRLYQADHINQLEVERIRREAVALTSHHENAGVAYAVLGMVAATKPDLNEVRKSFGTALRLASASHKVPLSLNYATSLLRACAAGEAADMAMATYRDYPDNLSVLATAMRTSLAAARFNNLLYLFSRWEALGQNLEERGTQGFALSDVEVVVARMKDLGYTDADVTARQDVAAEVLRKAGVPFNATGISVLPDGSVRHSFCISVTEDRAVELSFDIAAAIASNFENTLHDLVTFSCSGTVGIEVSDFFA